MTMRVKAPAGQVVKKTFEVPQVQFSDSSEVTQLVPQEQNSKCTVEIKEVPESSAMKETGEALKLAPQMGQSDFEERFLKESVDSSIPHVMEENLNV